MDLPVCDPDPTPTSSPAPSAVPTSSSTSVDLFPCPHSDTEVVHKLAALLLHALSTAAVDSTAGDPFNSPSSVASDLRLSLTDHLLSLSLTFIPQTLASLAVDPTSSSALPDLDDPLDVLSHLLDLFSLPRRSLLARLSVYLLSDSRDDKIDSFVHDLSSSSFWPLDQRLSLAAQTLKNIDYKHKFHCNRKFVSQPDLEHHKHHCEFRPVQCRNEGCFVEYCKARQEKHEEVCVYKVLECEQRCGDRVVRREMDRHCITVCRMKIVNCPFFQAGCGSAFPQGQVEEHCGEFLRGHLVCVLGVRNEEGLEKEEIERRADILDKSQFRDELAEATNVRRLTLAIKKVEAKMKQQELDKENIRKEQISNIKRQEELYKEKNQKEQANNIEKQPEVDKNNIENEKFSNIKQQEEINSIQNEQSDYIKQQTEFDKDSVQNEQQQVLNELNDIQNDQGNNMKGRQTLNENMQNEQEELDEGSFQNVQANIQNEEVENLKQQEEFYVEADNIKQQEVDEDSFQSEQTNIQNKVANDMKQQDELDVNSNVTEKDNDIQQQEEFKMGRHQNEQANNVKQEQELDSDNVQIEQANVQN